MIKQNESELANTDFKTKRIISLFPVVFLSLQLPLSLEPIGQFQGGLL